MTIVEACRICLAMNVKMNHILSICSRETYFEQIIGINPVNKTELPPYVCYECSAMISKFSTFKEKCLRGQDTLYTILHSNGNITAEEIEKVDRHRLHLASHLSFKLITDKDVVVCSNDDFKLLEVKEEPLGPTRCEIVYEIDDLKMEYDEAVPAASSDDDEPLSLHKSDDEPRFIDNSDDNEPLSLHKSGKDKIIKEKLKKKQKKEKRREKKTKSGSDSKRKMRNVKGMDLTALLLEKARRSQQKKVKKVRKPPSDETARQRRTRNTGGVESDDFMNVEDFADVITLSMEEQLAEVEQRKYSSNYLNSQFQCSFCFKGFLNASAWDHHKRKHDPSAGDVECPVCKFRFKDKRTLQKHSSNHEKKYSCKSCSYVSKTTTQAKQHQRWHKGVVYKCEYCDEISTKWTSYLSHVRIKHPSEFICGSCGYSFVSQLGLTMHRTMMHKQEKLEPKEEPGPYCEKCDVTFSSEEAWKRHMVMSTKHTQSTEFKNGCRACGESFGNSEDLRIHHRTKHSRQRPKNYGKKPNQQTWPAKCEHCTEEIPNAREYWNHFRRAHPDKKYPIEKNHICDICGKSFRGNAFLVYHRRTHSSERMFKCTLCNRAFHNRGNLQMHLKTHSDSRPYPCTLCFKAFKNKGALDRHFRCHTGDKPYECEMCKKAFSQSNSLKVHVLTVHLKQPAPYLSRSRAEKRKQQQTSNVL